MFALSVSIRLKPNSVAEFDRALENDIVPLLRKREGFRDEFALVAPNGSEVVAISLWDQKESVDAYGRETYPEVLKTLGKLARGTPEVHTREFPFRPSTRLPLTPRPETDTFVGGGPGPLSLARQRGETIRSRRSRSCSL